MRSLTRIRRWSTGTFGWVAIAFFLGGSAWANIPKKQDMNFRTIEFRLVSENHGDPGPWLTLQSTHELLKIEEDSIITTLDVEKAEVRPGQPGKASVVVDLTPAGSARLALATTQNAGRRLAIVVDGKLTMAPKILDPITGGQALIITDVNVNEARRLAQLINSSLGAPLWKRD